jgi:hypothetical protein
LRLFRASRLRGKKERQARADDLDAFEFHLDPKKSNERATKIVDS